MPDPVFAACDCHIHIYDTRFPMSAHARPEANASVEEYRRVQQRLGTTRTVVVQPAAHGTDNRATVAAVQALGRSNSRGIAVVHPSAADEELEAMADAGIVGLRFTQHDPKTAVTTPDMIEPLAHRVARLGWHVQLHLLAPQIVAMQELIERLPGTIVIDHMARLPQPGGLDHPAWTIVKRLLDRGRTWVKLSGPYLDTRIGPPLYSDVWWVARAFVRDAPVGCVWGSDWPHPTERQDKPDDMALLDLLAEWAGGEAARRRILVDNPASLYGFG